MFVRDIKEVHPQSLYILIEEGRATAESVTQTFGETQIEDLHPVRATGKTFEILWKRYIAYCVRNESYASAANDEEMAAGKNLRVYTKSHFLDYIARATFASPEYPGPFRHYRVFSENHVIDVASVDAPEIQVRMSF